MSILFETVRHLPYIKNMNKAARDNLTETALYLAIYNARVARQSAAGTPAFPAAERRVAAAYAALVAFRSTTLAVAA